MLRKGHVSTQSMEKGSTTSQPTNYTNALKFWAKSFPFLAQRHIWRINNQMRNYGRRWGRGTLKRINFHLFLWKPIWQKKNLLVWLSTKRGNGGGAFYSWQGGKRRAKSCGVGANGADRKEIEISCDVSISGCVLLQYNSFPVWEHAQPSYITGLAVYFRHGT